MAAGRGTRLGELTAHTPKPMLTVAGAPILAHILAGLKHAGVEQTIVVAGYLAEQIEEFCARRAGVGGRMKIATVRQRELNGTAGAMLAAMPLLAGEQRFLLGWGDILMDRASYARFMEQARSAEYDLMLAVNRTADPYRGGAVYLDAGMRVERIVEKPPRGTSTTNWNNAGLFASTPRLFDYVRRLVPSPRGELELPEAVAAMIRDGLVVLAVDIRGFWSDIGEPDDLERAREQFKPLRPMPGQ